MLAGAGANVVCMADDTPVPSGPDFLAPTSASDDLARWTTPPASPAADPDEIASEPAARRTLSNRAKTVGIVGTAVAVGFIGVLVMQGGSSAATTDSSRGGPPGAGQGGFPGAQNGQQGFRGGGFGRGTAGTVSAVSGSSITVAGTTLKVTSATEVIVDGAQGSISQVKKGDTALVMTGGSGTAERIIVGGFPGGGQGGFPGGGRGGFLGGGQGGPPGAQQQGGTSSTDGSTDGSADGSTTSGATTHT